MEKRCTLVMYKAVGVSWPHCAGSVGSVFYGVFLDLLSSF